MKNTERYNNSRLEKHTRQSMKKAVFPTNDSSTFIFYLLAFLNSTAVTTCLEYSLDNTTSAKPIARIIDGVDADKNEFAFVVAIESNRGSYEPWVNVTRYRKCTGTLINKHFVISAAHCSKSAHRIRYGDLTVPSTSRNASRRNIIKKYIHDNYESFDAYKEKHEKYEKARGYIKNDIALYRVEPVNLTKYAQLSAVDYKTMTGLSVQIIGVGQTSTSKMKIAEIKNRLAEDDTRERQIAYGVVRPCGKLSGKVLFYPLICVAYKCNSKQNTRVGDSGGPLLHDGKLIGVLMGSPPIDGQLQSVFTPVSVYLEWIRIIVHSENVTKQIVGTDDN